MCPSNRAQLGRRAQQAPGDIAADSVRQPAGSARPRIASGWGRSDQPSLTGPQVGLRRPATPRPVCSPHGRLRSGGASAGRGAARSPCAIARCSLADADQRRPGAGAAHGRCGCNRHGDAQLLHYERVQNANEINCIQPGRAFTHAARPAAPDRPGRRQPSCSACHFRSNGVQLPSLPASIASILCGFSARPAGRWLARLVHAYSWPRAPAFLCKPTTLADPIPPQVPTEVSHQDDLFDREIWAW